MQDLLRLLLRPDNYWVDLAVQHNHRVAQLFAKEN